MAKFKETMENLKSVMALYQRSHRSMAAVLICYGLAAASQPFGSLFFSAAILDDVIVGDIRRAVYHLLWLLGCNLILGVIVRICTQVLNSWKKTIDHQVEMQTNEKAYRMEFEELEKPDTLDAINRVRISILSNGGMGYLLTQLMNMMASIFGCLWSAGFILHLFSRTGNGSGGPVDSVWAVLLLAAGYAVIFITGNRIQCRANRVNYESKKEGEHTNSLFSYFYSLIFNYKNGKDIRLYRMQDIVLNRMDRALAPGQARAAQEFKNLGIAEGANRLLLQIAACLSYVFVCGKVLSGSISIGSVLLYAGAINRLTENISEIAKTWNTIYYQIQYLKEYKAFIDRPNMHYDGTLPIEKRNDKRYELTFDHVTFCYPGTTEPVLRDVSFKFDIGRRYALVGRNGAGKSTLIKLLCRLYEPTSGRILLNGVDIGLYDYDEYVQIFSVVFQDFRLFAFPLDENVAGSAEVDARKAQKSLEQAGFGERLKTLPKGLSTRLYHNTGEGIELSGGEAQKVAIARALYKDAPFVVLDEPTAALDPLAEAEVYQHFNELIQNKTAIYISHRMSSCQFCDEILVLEDGQIAERGSHEELVAGGGLYAQLYEAQAVHYR